MTFRNKLLLLFVLVFGITGTSVAQQFDLKDLVEYRYYPKSAGSGFRSLPDGEHYTIMSPDRTKILKYAYSSGELVDTLFDVEKARECDFGSFDDYIISDNGLRIIILRETKPLYRRSRFYTAYHYDVRRNMISPLNETPGKVRIPTFSPNGRMCAYVIDNDIYIKKFDYDTEVRVTTDGQWNHVLNGVTDWVYEEELYQINTMTWSEDSKYLTFLRTDESNVKLFEMTVFGTGNYPYTYDYKYPKAGEENAKTGIRHYHVDNRNTVSLLEKELSIEEQYIPRMEYHDGKLYVLTLNRNQNHLRTYQVDPDSRVAKLWMQHSDDCYIDTNSWVLQMQITPKGTYYVSDEGGTAQIYLYSTAGTRQKQLTSSPYDVTEVYGVSPAGEVFYQIAAPTPMDRQVVATTLDGRTRLLSPETGYSRATFSADMGYYLLEHSTITELPKYSIYSGKSAKELLLLEDNSELRNVLSTKNRAHREFIRLNTANGQVLNALVTKPIGFVEGKRYPVVMTQYSGPGSQEVLNRFSLNWEQYLAQEGFVVVSVDGRGTGGRGRDFLKCTYQQLGLLESEDQIMAAQALAELPYVDGSNIAIWGWSYGGYNVLMSMSRGQGTFKAGIAVAPPTDWRLYDTIYTERYMRTPQQNRSGYDQASVFTHISGLQGALLLVQGTADDNVHFQNVMHLVPYLVDHNKDYRMLIYPDRDHSIRGGNTSNHLYRQMVNFLKENLK